MTELVLNTRLNRIPQRKKFIEKFDMSTLELEKVLEDRRQAEGSNAQPSSSLGRQEESVA